MSDESAGSLARKLRALRRELERAAGRERGLRAAERRAREELGRARADLEHNNRSLGEALASVHRTQEQLIQGEKMASLGLLVAGIAHEIKNPLNFVNNFAELALELVEELRARRGAREGDAAEVEATLATVAENLGRIRQHGQRADAIINAMLMHVRDVRGESITVDFNAMLVEYTNLAYHGFRASDVAFTAEIVKNLDSSLGPVTGPYQELARVIINLVSNACHAMRERQRLGDRRYRPTLRIETRRSDNTIELVIADNGIGIAPEVRRHLFDPFFTTKPPGEGTGLGLSLSYEVVVNELGGAIEVASSAGEGATFTVRVPVGASAGAGSGPREP